MHAVFVGTRLNPPVTFVGTRAHLVITLFHTRTQPPIAFVRTRTHPLATIVERASRPHGTSTRSYLLKDETTSVESGISQDPPKPGTPRTRPFWTSPVYPALVGNILAEYLSFSHHPFPEPESKIHPYPSLADTYAHLRRFAVLFLASGQIRLSTEVVSVDELPGSSGWNVTTRDWGAGKDGEVYINAWDAVVVATSWYDFPSWPESTPGLGEARAAGLATHAQTWHGPVGYDGKRVVVVDIDAVVLGTGYSAASAPFVCILQPPSLGLSTGQPQALTPLASIATSPPRIPALYNHILYAPNPTLVFIGAVMAYTPFILADCLAIPASLPARLEEERVRLEKVERFREAGAKLEGCEFSSLVAYHILGPNNQDYAQGLKDAIAALEPEWAKVLPEWNDKEWKEGGDDGEKLVKLVFGGDSSKL
ncbi:hypothetical protein B0H14DRAFT_3534896 [Mycena olivaceomarginata]|nr:hypothetical protein B0H14DRAFT_3534896 [Mycena olivaceomarginata]